MVDIDRFPSAEIEKVDRYSDGARPRPGDALHDLHLEIGRIHVRNLPTYFGQTYLRLSEKQFAGIRTA